MNTAHTRAEPAIITKSGIAADFAIAIPRTDASGRHIAGKCVLGVSVAARLQLTFLPRRIAANVAKLCAFCLRLQLLDYVVDSILGSVDLALIEFTSSSGRGILCLVEVANAETEHMRKDFIALCGADPTNAF